MESQLKLLLVILMSVSEYVRENLKIDFNFTILLHSFLSQHIKMKSE